MPRREVTATTFQNSTDPSSLTGAWPGITDEGKRTERPIPFFGLGWMVITDRSKNDG